MNYYLALVMGFGLACAADPQVKPQSDLSGIAQLDAIVDSDAVPESEEGLIPADPSKLPNGVPTVEGNRFNMTASLAAFTEKVTPLLAERCGGCHAETQAPFFAAPDNTAAHSTVLERKLVDFGDPTQSRLATKVAQSHNCWDDCAANAAELTQAVIVWKDALEAAGGSTAAAFAFATSDIGFTEAPEKEGRGDPGTIVFLATEFDSITGPVALMQDDPDGPAEQYLTVSQNRADLGDADAGMITYSFTVEKAGSYGAFAKVKHPSQNTGQSNEFYWRLDSTDPDYSIDWQLFRFRNSEDQNDNVSWFWSRITGMDPMDNNAPMQVPTFGLIPGETYTLTFQHRDPNARINRLAISKTPQDFEGAEIPGMVRELRFDLSALVGATATLVVDAGEFLGENNAILLRDLRIETEKPVLLRSIKPLINGSWDPKHAAYTAIDQTVPAGTTLLSETGVIIHGKDGFAVDRLSFAFDAIQ